jgi:hypothetical protein
MESRLAPLLSCYGSQPGFFPEKQASRLTPAVSLPVTAGFKMDGMRNTATAKVWVASLVRDFVNLKTPATKLEHLRHERHSVKLTVLIESPQNLFFATDFYPLAYGQVPFCLHRIPYFKRLRHDRSFRNSTT